MRAQLPLDERIRQFKELLQEKEVSAYATWERELQKIVFDPRYLLLTSKERKQVFEKYVRDRAEEEKAEKSAAMKKKRDEFRALLREAGVSLKTPVSFLDFSATKHAKDERFKSVEKLKDRESMFNDYLAELSRQEKEDKYAEKEKLRKNFYAMLREMKSSLHRHSSWTETKRILESDARYKAIDSSSKREDYFRDYCKGLDEKPVESSKSSSASHRDKERGERERDHRDSGKDKDRKHKHKDRSEKDDEDSKMDHDDHESKKF